MDSSIELNNLNDHSNEENGLPLLIPSLMQYEHYDVVAVYAFTLMIIAAVSIIMGKLWSRRRRANNIFDKETIVKLAAELHDAADKCYMAKYFIRCLDFGEYCPRLINVKCRTTGFTPFHLICFHGEAHLLKFMLYIGADPCLTTDSGESPICLAIYAVLLNAAGDAHTMSCLDILLRAGSTLEKRWYDLLFQKALDADKTALALWLLRNKKALVPIKSSSFGN